MRPRPPQPRPQASALGWALRTPGPPELSGPHANLEAPEPAGWPACGGRRDPRLPSTGGGSLQGRAPGLAIGASRKWLGSTRAWLVCEIESREARPARAPPASTRTAWPHRPAPGPPGPPWPAPSLPGGAPPSNSPLSYYPCAQTPAVPCSGFVILHSHGPASSGCSGPS